MKNSVTPRNSTISSVLVRRFTWILVGGWTLFLSGLTFDEITDIRQITREIGISEIRAYSNKDLALRLWISSHNGVYVPVDERTPESPYLAHVSERDLVTPSGKKITLMNPAYMMRQVGEDFATSYGGTSRMTSLSPLRPENGPDAWERRALEEFARLGKKEKLEFTQISGVPHLRLIQAMPLTPDCLECHVHKRYKQGDVRGGISISLSMVEALARQDKQIFFHVIRVALLWFIGMAGLFFGDSLLRRRVAERDAAQEALQISLDRLALQGRELEEVNVELSEEIAERKRVEAEILVNEEKFRTVADFTYAWEYWVDPDGNFLYVSPSSERVTGYRPEEFKEYPRLITEIVHPDDRALMTTHFCDAVSERSVCILDFRIITKAGLERWIGHICQPVYGGSGEFLGIRGSNRDITGSKWNEKALKKYAMDLATSNRDLQDFASMASHDLREPVVLVQAFSERLRVRYGENIPEHGLEYIRRIEMSAARMLALISGMLTYSRVSSKAQPFEEIDLEKIVLQVIADLEMRITESGGRVEVGDLCRIKADPLQIRQLFQNLIANALKYNQPDLPPRVLVSGKIVDGPDAQGGADFCRITVEDNGIGFAEDSAERIFGLFQRLHGADQYEGTGIGLAVCKRIVERHGGTITAQGSPGQGARFVVTLPVHGPAMDDFPHCSCREEPVFEAEKI